MPIDLAYRSARRRSSSQPYVLPRGSPVGRPLPPPSPIQSNVLPQPRIHANQRALSREGMTDGPILGRQSPPAAQPDHVHRRPAYFVETNMDGEDVEEDDDATDDDEDGMAFAENAAAAAAAAAAYFQAKTVIALKCNYCRKFVTARAMRAILLADTKVELFSTDHPPVSSVQLVDEDYSTSNCNCKIRDVGCLGCGNVIGYHVTRPCQSCLSSCNNGHFWMFHSDAVTPIERLDPSGKRLLLWECIGGPQTNRDVARMSFGVPETMERICR